MMSKFLKKIIYFCRFNPKIYCTFFCICIIYSSCNEESSFAANFPNQPENANISSERVEKSLSNNLLMPEVILLSAKPPPKIVEVPTEIESNNPLLPPTVKRSGLFYMLQHYGLEQGLTLDSVLCGIFDELGNLWIGTNGAGIVKFDGYTFTSYPGIIGNRVNAVSVLLFDNKGRLWVGTDGGGVNIYDGKTFSTFGRESGVVGNRVNALFQDKLGQIWIGTDEGLVFCDGTSFKFFNMSNEPSFVSNDVLSIGEDHKGNLWFGTQGGGLNRFDGKNFTKFTTQDGLSQNTVISIITDTKGNLWLGTDGEGVSKFDGKVFENFSVKDGLSNNFIRCMTEDSYGNIWFGTDEGASEYDGIKFVRYTTAEGLTNGGVRFITEDRLKNLWFGTYDGGVYRFEGKAFQNFTSSQGLPPKHVRTIFEDSKNNLWVGTRGGGLVKYDGSNFTTYTTSQGLINDNVESLYEDKEGGLWIATGGGLSYFNGKSFKNFTTEQGLVNNNVRGILKDKDESLWFFTEKGLSKYDGQTFKNYNEKQGFKGLRSMLLSKSGEMWLGTTEEGLLRYDGQKVYVESNVNKTAVFALIEDKEGNIWIGTGGEGVIRYDGHSFKKFSEEQGLPNNVIYALAINKDQEIVLGSNLGITFIKGFNLKSEGKNNFIPSQNNLLNEALERYSLVLENYDSKRNYPIADANASPNSIYLDSKGILWMGTGSKKTNLVRIDTSKIIKDSNPPNVQIKEIKVDNESLAWEECLKNEKNSNTEEIIKFGKSLTEEEKKIARSKFCDITFKDTSNFYYIPSELVLPYKHNNITFDFVAVEPIRPSNVIYQSILEGYDKDWSPPSNSLKANFGNIFEGNYTFKVKAKSPFGVWSEPIAYNFKVLPPLYRTWWAYTIYAIGTVGSLWALYRWRTAKLRRQYELAERFVPKKVLELLNKKHLEDVQLGDSVKLKINAMFADIRGFTTLSESLTPEQTALFLNTYTHYMAPLIQNNNGFINQFLGDGILALFPEKASDSVEGALAMLDALPKFNEEIKTQGFEPVSVGIGINAGDAMLFALGVKDRLDASIVSDAINTASRVEGLNKYYKTQLLISDTVYNQLPNPEKYTLRLVDKVFLKGKNVGTKIYEVQKLSQSTTESSYLNLYNKAFTYYEQGDFVAGESTFQLCLDQKPEDGVAQLLLTRCSNMKESPTPSDWDGTLRLSEK